MHSSISDLSPSPPLELPRFRIYHVAIWMAATAVVSLPIIFEWQTLARAGGSVVSAISHSPVAMGTYAMQGMAAGTCLFVSITVANWKRKGLVDRLQPGHWLAIQGIALWAFSIVGLAILLLDNPNFASRLATYAQITVVCAFSLCFFGLAVRGRDPARWRWTYVVFAVAPLAGWWIGALVAERSNADAFAARISQGLRVLGQSLALVIAMGCDLGKRYARHWSHWLGAGAYLLALLGTAAIEVVVRLFPQILLRNP